MARSLLITGAKVFLYVNGRPYGRCADFRWNSDTPARSIRGIDSMEPFELAPTVSNVSGSMTIYRLSNDGGAEGAGLVAPVSELSREKYASMMLIERNTNQVLFRTDFVKLTGQSWSAPARGYVMGNLSFEAIGYSNEVREFTA